MGFLFLIDGHLDGLVVNGERKTLIAGAVDSSISDSEECEVRLGGGKREDEEQN